MCFVCSTPMLGSPRSSTHSSECSFPLRLFLSTFCMCQLCFTFHVFPYFVFPLLMLHTVSGRRRCAASRPSQARRRCGSTSLSSNASSSSTAPASCTLLATQRPTSFSKVRQHTHMAHGVFALRSLYPRTYRCIHETLHLCYL